MAALVIIVMGVSGCGKTTIGKAIAENRHAVFVDGDSLHSKANVEKMQQGIALTDTDREEWFERIIQKADAFSSAGEQCVFACSALKKKYRDWLRAKIDNIIFIYLKVSYERAYKQISERENHYMPVTLLKSQFDTLEEPGPEEKNIKTVYLSDFLKENIASALYQLSL